MTVFTLLNRGISAHLTWIWRVTTEFPRRVLALSVFLLLPALLSVATLRFESDIFRLFPAGKGALRLFLDTLEWSGSGQEAYFVLEGEKERLIPAATEFARKLSALSVDGQPAFTKVTWRSIDPAEAGPFARFIGYAVSRPELFVTPEDVPRLRERLTAVGMDEALQRSVGELAGQTGMIARDLVAVDPLGLRDFFLPRLNQARQSLDLDPSSPYFLSRDGKVLVIIAEPARPIQDMAFARKLVAGINSARAGSPVAITCAGAHLSAVIDESTMRENVIECVISSLFVVLGLFYVTYRRVLPTLLIPVIIGYGSLLALGAAGLFLSSVHIISFAFTALVIGLGTDYSIHIYDRFHWERAAGAATTEALRLAVINTGHGVFTAALTTALPFLAMTITDVRALFELGLLVGLGVIFSLYATLFFLPPLLILMEQRNPRFVYQPLPGFGLGPLWNFCGRRCRLVIGTSVAVVLGLLALTPRLSFEGELKNLQPRDSEAFLTQERIERHLSLSPKTLTVAVEGADLTTVLARGARVDALSEQYRRRGELVAWSSLGQVLNGPEQQRMVRKELARLPGGNDLPGEIRAALERNGFAPDAFSAALDSLAGFGVSSSGDAGEAVTRLAESPLKGILTRHLIRHDGIWRLLSHLSYRGEEFHRQRFLEELAALDSAARTTGVDLISDQLLSSVKRSFAWVSLIGGVLVLLLLVTQFKSLAGILASLLPVFAGMVVTLGLMVLTGMKINFMNAMIFITILGMGSDYGIHIFYRAGAVGPDQRDRFIQSGRAVLLSALTTIAGFGSLAFTDYGAMSSIGWATNYGIGATTLFSLVALPAFIRWSKNSQTS